MTAAITPVASAAVDQRPNPVEAADVHVVPNGDMWTLKLERMSMAMPQYQTQAEAIGLGIRLARELAVQLVIHGENGQFRDVWNYAR